MSYFQNVNIYASTDLVTTFKTEFASVFLQVSPMLCALSEN